MNWLYTAIVKTYPKINKEKFKKIILILQSFDLNIFMTLKKNILTILMELSNAHPFKCTGNVCVWDSNYTYIVFIQLKYI